jgi:RNA polymerase sigma factor (sigma-70 family)
MPDENILSQKVFFRNKRTEFTDLEIIDGLKTDNSMIIKYLYRKFFPGIKSLVYSCHHLRLVPEDIFQEGMTRAILNIRNGSFEGKSSFYTYFSAICKNICLKEIRMMSHFNYNDDINPDIQDVEYESFEILPVMIEVKNRMDEYCRHIIDLRFNIDISGNEIPEVKDRNKNMRFETIAEMLGIEPDNARQRYKRCLEKLRNMLLTDPRWNDYWKTV